jgi:protein-S-isoprenylcysteine O-methyltransferase Ste14
VLAFELPAHRVIAALVASLGAGLVLVAGLGFRRAGTTVNPTKPQATTSVVDSGVYRLSRNPMYVGFLLVLAGWAAFLSHVLPFLFLPAYVGYMNRFQIAPEERMLAPASAPATRQYRQRVRRWL